MRARLFLGLTAVLLATVGITVVVNEQLSGGDRGGTGAAQVVGGGNPSGPSPSGTAPQGDTIRATGTATALHVEGAQLDPQALPTPLTVVADAGFGNGAELTGVLVDGVTSTVVWDGGRPFVLSGGGGLLLDAVTADATPAGLRLGLAGAVHELAAGTYRLDTPVAVGSGGVTSGVEQLTFDADAGSSLVARGDAGIVLPDAGPHHLVAVGPLHLEGSFTVLRNGQTTAASTLDTTGGVVDLTLLAAGDGTWTITLVASGELTAS